MLKPTEGYNRSIPLRKVSLGFTGPVNVAIVETTASAAQDEVRVHSAWLDNNFKGVVLGVAQAACEI
jgi:hypothetical protein